LTKHKGEATGEEVRYCNHVICPILSSKDWIPNTQSSYGVPWVSDNMISHNKLHTL